LFVKCSLHNKPYPFYRVEVWRIEWKIDWLEEVPVKALSFVPGGVIKDKNIPFSIGSD